jgi:hypothetical protein
MFGQHDFDTHLSGALHHIIEVVHFEPEQDTVAIWPVVGVGDRTVMVCDFEAVQLEDQVAVGYELFVFIASMIAATAQQALIPEAAPWHVGNGDEWLRPHGGSAAL